MVSAGVCAAKAAMQAIVNMSSKCWFLLKGTSPPLVLLLLMTATLPSGGLTLSAVHGNTRPRAEEETSKTFMVAEKSNLSTRDAVLSSRLPLVVERSILHTLEVGDDYARPTTQQGILDYQGADQGKQFILAATHDNTITDYKTVPGTTDKLLASIVHRQDQIIRKLERLTNRVASIEDGVSDLSSEGGGHRRRTVGSDSLSDQTNRDEVEGDTPLLSEMLQRIDSKLDALFRTPFVLNAHPNTVKKKDGYDRDNGMVNKYEYNIYKGNSKVISHKLRFTPVEGNQFHHQNILSSGTDPSVKSVQPDGTVHEHLSRHKRSTYLDSQFEVSQSNMNSTDNSLEEDEETTAPPNTTERRVDGDSGFADFTRPSFNELLSLVRWLVRKIHMSHSTQTGLFNSMVRALNLRHNLLEENVLEAIAAAQNAAPTQVSDQRDHQGVLQMDDNLKGNHTGGEDLGDGMVVNASSEAAKMSLTSVCPIIGDISVSSLCSVVSSLVNQKELGNYVIEANDGKIEDEGSGFENAGESLHFTDIDGKIPELIEENRVQNQTGAQRSENFNETLLFKVRDVGLGKYNDTEYQTASSNTTPNAETATKNILADNNSVVQTPSTAEHFSWSTLPPTTLQAPDHVTPPTATSSGTQAPSTIEVLQVPSPLQEWDGILDRLGFPQGQSPAQGLDKTSSELPARKAEHGRVQFALQSVDEDMVSRLGHAIKTEHSESTLESRLQSLEEHMVGLQIYFDTAVLRLRNQIEAALTASESSLASSLSRPLTASLDTVKEVQTAVLQVADAAVTSVSSAAVAAGHHTTDILSKLIKKTTVQIKRALRQRGGGCPEHYTKIGGLCLAVPNVSPPVPFLPVGVFDGELMPPSPSLLPTYSAYPEEHYNWTEARTLCRSYEGDLATILKTQETSHLFWALQHHSSRTGFWLGAKIKRKVTRVGASLGGVDTRIGDSSVGNRAKLKWVTGEYSQVTLSPARHRGSARPTVTDYVACPKLSARSEEPTDLDGRGDEEEIVADFAESEEKLDDGGGECLLLVKEGHFKVVVESCRSEHRPLCQYIPTLL